jgi:hypothetical protein
MKYAVDNTQDRASMIFNVSIVKKSEVRGSSMLIGMFPSDYIVPLISVPPRKSNYMCDEKPTAGKGFSSPVKRIIKGRPLE